MKLFSVITLFLVIFTSSLSTHALTLVKCPDINEKTLTGVWEAIYTEGPVRVFRLEVLKNGSAILSQGLDGGGNLVSKLNRKIIKDGKLDLFFRNNKGGEDHLSGTGYACENISGVLEVQLQMEPDLPDPSTWKLRFINYGNDTSLTEAVNKMANEAKSATTNLKK